tara:strand:+ start:5631 stop:5798 length:168 start_codon:yes stop_codon:yes gene_type:complete
MERYDKLVDTTYKPNRDALYDGTEPIVIALRDIQATLQTLLNLYIEQNREKSGGK